MGSGTFQVQRLGAYVTIPDSKMSVHGTSKTGGQAFYSRERFNYVKDKLYYFDFMDYEVVNTNAKEEILILDTNFLSKTDIRGEINAYVNVTEGLGSFKEYIKDSLGKIVIFPQEGLQKIVEKVANNYYFATNPLSYGVADIFNYNTWKQAPVYFGQMTHKMRLIGGPDSVMPYNTRFRNYQFVSKWAHASKFSRWDNWDYYYAFGDSVRFDYVDPRFGVKEEEKLYAYGRKGRYSLVLGSGCQKAPFALNVEHLGDKAEDVNVEADLKQLMLMQEASVTIPKTVSFVEPAGDTLTITSTRQAASFDYLTTRGFYQFALNGFNSSQSDIRVRMVLGSQNVTGIIPRNKKVVLLEYAVPTVTGNVADFTIAPTFSWEYATPAVTTPPLLQVNPPALVINVLRNVTFQFNGSDIPSFAFGDTYDTVSRDITLVNKGNWPVDISAITVSGLGFGVTGIPRPLNPNESIPLSVTFAAGTNGGGAKTGSLAVTSPNRNTGVGTLGLTGNAVTRSVVVNTLNFGVMVQNTPSVSRTLTITNNGSGPVRINQITPVGPYTFDSPGNFTIPANAGTSSSVTINVTASTAALTGDMPDITLSTDGGSIQVTATGSVVAVVREISIAGNTGTTMNGQPIANVALNDTIIFGADIAKEIIILRTVLSNSPITLQTASIINISTGNPVALDNVKVEKKNGAVYIPFSSKTITEADNNIILKIELNGLPEAATIAQWRLRLRFAALTPLTNLVSGTDTVDLKLSF